MKEKLTRNIGLKILSIILAALLWLIITNAEDPITTGSFDNVPVQVLNEGAIKSNNQTYRIIDGETIDFTIAARRKIKDSLTASDFKVTADLSKLTDLNTATINISCPLYDDEVKITSKSSDVLKIAREQLSEKSFQVTVTQKGEPAEGYYVAKKTVRDLLTISGPESKVASIAEVIAEVDVTGESSNLKTQEVPKVYDKDGNEIDKSDLKFGTNWVLVDTVMYRTKTINLIVNVTGKPADGYVMTAIDYQPKQIEVAGDYASLSNIQELKVDQSIEGASQTLSEVINLQDKLGSNLIFVGDNPTATVNITIERSATKDVTIQPGNIEIRNLPVSLEMVYMSSLPVTLTLSGPAEAINGITEKSITPYVDLTDFYGGTYEIPINIEAPENVTLANSPKVTVYLRAK
jgi:YbbR domain-containing protein